MFVVAFAVVVDQAACQTSHAVTDAASRGRRTSPMASPEHVFGGRPVLGFHLKANTGTVSDG